MEYAGVRYREVHSVERLVSVKQLSTVVLLGDLIEGVAAIYI
jgi:hypothetical protein